MTSTNFLKLAKSVTKIVKSYKNRPLDREGNPGGLINLPDNCTTLVVGDLHGAVGNLKAIINDGTNAKDLANGKCYLVITGDALHNDQTGKMLEMKSSLDSLEYLFTIMNKYPGKVIYIRGNHDTFDERLSKSGIRQGVEFRNYLAENTNEACVVEVEKFFEILPLCVIGKGFIITHAGPVKRGITKEELININEDKNSYMQLLWNRLHEFRGNPSIKEYDEDDIRKMLEKLKLPSSTHFIVGHNPLWNTGEKNGVWMNVLGIKNHHIIYSNLQTPAPYFIIKNGEIKVKYAIQAKPEAFYV
jgi:predicted phosphodiesterase